MWKTIINWINSKSYRCRHNWIKETENNTFLNPRDKVPYYITILYRCTKCCEFKSKILK